jgi:molybdate/tungstate transport system ATP-binding protein
MTLLSTAKFTHSNMIEVNNLSLTIGDFSLKDINLTVPSGSYAVLLGPTGSGKTVLIETLCGLHRQDQGRIFIDGHEVSSRDPGARGIGYLPQDYVLFDHLNVAENISFGLRVRGINKKEMLHRTYELMEILGISELAPRSPLSLSGGERQRVALGRALAPRPSLLLLDEPVSALDEQLRLSVCRELKEIQRKVGATTIHISHNFEETLEVADRIAVIMDGRIVQEGIPSEVFCRPATIEVARFVGTENIFSGFALKKGGGSLVHVNGLEIFSEEVGEGHRSFYLSAEGIGFHPDGKVGGERNSFRGAIGPCRALNRGVRVHIDIGIPLAIWVSPRELASLGLSEGTHMTVDIDPGAVHFLTSSSLF